MQSKKKAKLTQKVLRIKIRLVDPSGLKLNEILITLIDVLSTINVPLTYWGTQLQKGQNQKYLSGFKTRTERFIRSEKKT